MAIRANPHLIDELELYGAQDVVKCYHCGNCSATCPFSGETYVFPRKSMRYLQLGLESRLRGNLEPWLCYYCGECSDECPREAEPGETMMAMRRWLTSRYDFTGISALFYRSWKAELIAIVLVALLTGLGFTLYGLSQGNIGVYDGEGAFLPSSMVHRFDWAMASLLVVLLGINCVRMWWFTVGSDRALKVSPWHYLSQAFLVPLHFFTQKRYRECDRKRPWAIHLALMLSYLTMLVLIMFFLHRMQHGPEIDWLAHGFGYAAALGLVLTTIYALHGRLRRTETHYEHSHETDWIFLVLLLLVTVTGIAQHALHRLGLPVAANVVYVVHMMGVVPMLVLEVPFSKWSHMAYRPLAMYLSAVREKALASARTEDGRPAAAVQTA
jgi:ferredoxin